MQARAAITEACLARAARPELLAAGLVELQARAAGLEPARLELHARACETKSARPGLRS